MSKDVHVLTIPDISALAKTLRRELEARDTRPSHVELLNIIARGAGFRNFQHLKASQSAAVRLEAPQVPAEPEPVDHRKIEQVLRCFDGSGVMARWPKKTSQQKLALWWCWAQIPARRDLAEREVNEILKRFNGFGDHVLIRRELIDWGMVSRSADCRIYRRIETRPPPEAANLIRHLAERVRAAVPPRLSNRPGLRRDPSPVPPAASPTSP
ncbi:DUF2087 domain-containing protein [Rhizobium sp. SL86]|uniref:DUF2087 domain-containing protein n=1 Tax=Rhizobium sp. SL86 TaxID=2995148 RepID=UPI002272E98C|nr:DUF2087 domain-containing protein [Rhizobium sp. SL86]MCY1664315.1 DUF2087 domain-containing protein [Rhizobium sp. SL86]